MPSRRLAVPLLFWALTLATAPAVRSWDRFGHEVVATIAWNEISATTRARANALLSAMPADSGFAELAAGFRGRPSSSDARRFDSASSWPDAIRSSHGASPGGSDSSRPRFDHPTWHYFEWRWRTSAAGRGADLDAPAARGEDLIERLGTLSRTLADPRAADPERAVALAWILHLVGDLHQPLHVADRVTPSEPRGDHGGTLFALASSPSGEAGNLHFYWDSILTRSYPAQSHEGAERRLTRVADRLMRESEASQAVSDSSLTLAGLDRLFLAWATESHELARTAVYPPDLVRGGIPTESYRIAASRIAGQAVARAGARLARLLELLLGS